MSAPARPGVAPSRPLALLLAALAASPAAAQEARGCDVPEANARYLSFPVERHTRAFARGRVRFLELDTEGEPACCSVRLMVLLPDPEGASDLCVLLSHEGALGWSDMALEAATAAYDAATGLTVAVPVAQLGADGPLPRSLAVTVNQQTGEVRAAYGPP